MNIYFDFEATQFSERVLAIGASCEYGDFDCLVSLYKKDKLTPFITQLTGITKEMLVGAPNAEQAFTDLYDWIGEMTKEADTPIFYHCYGDSDAAFLINTANKMEQSKTRNFVLNLAESLLDDSHKVKKFFHSKAIGLHKALKYFEPELLDQTHDPLDDAILLRQLMEHLDSAEALDECPFEECAGEVGKPKKKKLPEIKNDKRHYMVVITHATDEKAKPKRFGSAAIATDWAYQKTLKKTPNATRKTVQKNAQKAIDNEGCYMGWKWHKEYID